MPLVMANETGGAHHRTSGHLGRAECGVWKYHHVGFRLVQVLLDRGHSS